MATITASDLLKRVNNSNKVHEVLEKLTSSMIDAADAGKTSFTTNVTDSNLTNAIVRQLKKRGFTVETHYGATQLEISWAKESATDTSNAICKDLEKAEQHYAEKSSETQKCNQCCTSVNGKPVDQTDDPKPQSRKKPLPTPPSSTAPSNQPGVTVLKNGKRVNNAQTQAPKPTNNQPQPQQNKRNKKRRYNRGGNVIFNNCTFNVFASFNAAK